MAIKKKSKKTRDRKKERYKYASKIIPNYNFRNKYASKIKKKIVVIRKNLTKTVAATDHNNQNNMKKT